jgi:hypothetical protein
MSSKLLCWKHVTNIIYMTLQLSSKLLCWQHITNSILSFYVITNGFKLILIFIFNSSFICNVFKILTIL